MADKNEAETVNFTVTIDAGLLLVVAEVLRMERGLQKRDSEEARRAVMDAMRRLRAVSQH